MSYFVRTFPKRANFFLFPLYQAGTVEAVCFLKGSRKGLEGDGHRLMLDH